MNYSEPFKSCYMMGALRLAANFKNTVCLINGPTGCAFFVRNTVLILNGYVHPVGKTSMPTILTTNYNEDDVIFGGIKKLANAINEINRDYSPEMIFVFNCCVSEVIGEDLEDAIINLDEDIQKKVIPVRSAGFKGDHRVGMKQMNEIIFDYFIKSLEPCTRPGTVNILGDTSIHHSSIQELLNVLKKAEVEVVASIPGHIDREAIENSVNASLNIIICGSASKILAAKYKENKKIPFYGNANSFFSVEESYKSYKDILKILGKDSGFIDEMYEQTKLRNADIKKKLSGRSVFIIAGARRAVGYANVLKELGMKIDFIFSESSSEYTTKADYEALADSVMCDEWENSLRNRIINEKPDLVISTIPEITAPIKSVARTVDDFMGFEGSTKMGEYVCKILEGVAFPAYWQTTEI